MLRSGVEKSCCVVFLERTPNSRGKEEKNRLARTKAIQMRVCNGVDYKRTQASARHRRFAGTQSANATRRCPDIWATPS